MENELLKPSNLKGTATAPVEQRLNAFMQELWSNTAENWLNERERIWQGLVGIEVEPRWGKIHISAIRTFPASLTLNGVSTRGQGHASKALDWLCTLADKYQVTLDGHARPFGGSDPDDKKTRFNKAQLMAWYKRHGFTVDSKGNMVRPAKGAEPEPEKPFVLKLRKDSPMVEIPLKASRGTMTCYHVTLAQNVPTILKEGLVPKRGPRAEALGESQEGIYLFPTMEDCETALGSWLGDEFEDADLTLLEVQVPENVRLLPTTAGYEVIVADPIPARNIKALDIEI